MSLKDDYSIIMMNYSTSASPSMVGGDNASHRERSVEDFMLRQRAPWISLFRFFFFQKTPPPPLNVATMLAQCDQLATLTTVAELRAGMPDAVCSAMV